MNETQIYRLLKNSCYSYYDAAGERHFVYHKEELKRIAKKLAQ